MDAPALSWVRAVGHTVAGYSGAIMQTAPGLTAPPAPAAVPRRLRRARGVGALGDRLRAARFDLHRAALICLLAVTFLLRLWGIRQGLPYSYNSDEATHFVPRAIAFFGHDLNPQYFLNPPAYSYLLHVVFDNESLLSVGGFPTTTATGSDLAALARAAGIPCVYAVDNLSDFTATVEQALAAGELATIVAKVEAKGPAAFVTDLPLLENRFQFQRYLRTAGEQGAGTS